VRGYTKDVDGGQHAAALAAPGHIGGGNRQGGWVQQRASDHDGEAIPPGRNSASILITEHIRYEKLPALQSAVEPRALDSGRSRRRFPADFSRNQVIFKCAQRFFTDHPTLSFEDCCLATYADLSNAQPLWTFDTKLAGQVDSARRVPV
jgi:hypothetical protein